MTKQQKTIKLAEWSGDWIIKDWKECKDWYSIIVEDKNGRICEFKNNGYAKELQFIDLPEYFEDLNATHNLEKVFTYDDISTPDPEREGCTYHTNTKAQYQRTLADVIAKEKEQEGMDSLKAFLFGIQESVNATAAHRAEAIGQTLKLW